MPRLQKFLLALRCKLAALVMVVVVEAADELPYKSANHDTPDELSCVTEVEVSIS